MLKTETPTLQNGGSRHENDANNNNNCKGLDFCKVQHPAAPTWAENEIQYTTPNERRKDDNNNDEGYFSNNVSPLNTPDGEIVKPVDLPGLKEYLGNKWKNSGSLLLRRRIRTRDEPETCNQIKDFSKVENEMKPQTPSEKRKDDNNNDEGHLSKNVSASSPDEDQDELLESVKSRLKERQEKAIADSLRSLYQDLKKEFQDLEKEFQDLKKMVGKEL
ncbi:uncharacterized protein LOC104265683 [Ciona intestinalis]